MWQKDKYGLYVSPDDHIIYWPDNTGWFVKGCKSDIWLKNGNGWGPIKEREVDTTFKGAALVAPLLILFWEKE